MLITYYLNAYYWMLAHGWNRMHNAGELSFSVENTHLSGLSPNMTPLNVSARATDSWSENSTKAKRVGCVSSPAILTNFTSPTCLKNSRSCSAVVLYRRKTSTTCAWKTKENLASVSLYPFYLHQVHGILVNIQKSGNKEPNENLILWIKCLTSI